MSRAAMERMKVLEREANELKAMSEDEKNKWTLQKRLQTTFRQYEMVILSFDNKTRIIKGMRNTNFIDDSKLRKMSRTELEWLIREADTVKPMLQELDKKYNESEKIYRTIKPQRDQLERLERASNNGALVRSNDSTLGNLMRQMNDIDRSQMQLAKTKRAYNHIIEQGKRAKKILDSLPRGESIANSPMAAFQ